MIFAVVGDIQGKFSALEKIISYLNNEGIHTCFQCGNFFVGEENPAAVLELIQSENVVCVQGEMEKTLLRFEKKRAGLEKRLDKESFDLYANAFDNASISALEFIRDLPVIHHLQIESIDIALCFGSPSSSKRILDETTPHTKLEREREIANAKILLVGGSENAFHCQVEDTLIISPGKCMQSDQINFSLVNTENKAWQVEEISLFV